MPSPKTIRLVRRVLLFSLIGFVGVLGFLLWFGQRRSTDPATLTVRETAPGEIDVDVTTGFDYTISIAGHKLMRIRADRVVSRGEREVHLEQVGPIELYRSDGNTIFVSADRGSFDLESGSSKLEGNVELQGAAGTWFSTDSLELAEEGKVVRSAGEVRLRKDEQVRGRANRFTANLQENAVNLVGRVRFDLAGEGGNLPYRLEGRRATYYSNRSEFRMAGGVTLIHADSRLQAREMAAFSGTGKGLKLVQFRRGVTGHWLERQADGGATRMDLMAQDLDLDFDDNGAITKTRLRRNRPAELRLTQGAKEQSLRGIKIEVLWQQGEPISGTAEQQAQIVEHTPTGGRSAFGERATFTFNAGDLSEMRMSGAVRVQEEDATTTGDLATYSATSRSFEVKGSPAETTFPSGSMTSPKITYDAATKVATAVATVRGEYRQGSEPGILGDGPGPARFEAQGATWEQSTEAVQLDGQARIWRERDLMIADTITSYLKRRSVEANGDVRVIMERVGDDPSAGPVATEAAADAMQYFEAERVIHLIGSATAQREGRTLSCGKLDVILGPDGDVERMNCAERTRLLDPVAGRTVVAETVVYRIGDEEALFTGDPVTATADDGSVVTGKRLIYRLATGEAIMDVGPQAAAESTAPEGALTEGGSEDGEAPELEPLGDSEAVETSKPTGDSGSTDPVTEEQP